MTRSARRMTTDLKVLAEMGSDEWLRGGDGGPASAALCIDGSTSMYGAKLQAAKDGTIDFAVSAIENGWKVSLIAFNREATPLVQPTTDIGAIGSAVSSLEAKGGTDIGAAVDCATEILGYSGTRAIVLLTDGRSEPKAAIDAANRAKKDGIDIICIHTDDADRELLDTIASARDLSKHVPRNQLRSALRDASKLLPPARDNNEDNGGSS